MKFKLDENIDIRLTPLFMAYGYDVETILSEECYGSADEKVYQLCLDEKRILITLDLDFANPLRFPPEPTEGIIIIRVPRPTLSILKSSLSYVLPYFNNVSLKGKLWIVEPGRIRVYDPWVNEI